MKTKIVFVAALFLPFFSLHVTASVAANPEALPSTHPIPDWIEPLSVSTEPIVLKPSQVNFQCLLIDTQRNWEAKTIYQHTAIKAITNRGVEVISKIQINFDPSFSKIHMHAIRIFRDGQWHDRLEQSRFQLLQREVGLEANLYYGELTVVYFLNDIRKGDILEYSYSVVGINPLVDSHFSDMVDMQREIAVEKISYRLVADPHLRCSVKQFHTEIEPKCRLISSTQAEWIWEDEETRPCESGGDCAFIQLSEYQDWGEFAASVYPLFALPSDFAHTIPDEMRALVHKWKETAYHPKDRALLAIRFVQDEIRYLGIEEGINGWKPRDPKTTFTCRFGDCKDKSFLLHALLELMDISSTPLIVNILKGDTLPDMLPCSYLFNHAVLQISIDGCAYFVDPTISLQGGTLETNAFPEYHFGLLIAKDTNDLTELPRSTPDKPAEVSTSFSKESADTIKIQIKSTYFDMEADAGRQLFTWLGMDQISSNSLLEIQENWGKEVAVYAPIEFHDDRFNNVITIVETYTLPVENYWESRGAHAALMSVMRSRIYRLGHQ